MAFVDLSESIEQALHILNAIKPHGRFFINDDGTQPSDSDIAVQTDDGVRKVSA